MVDSTLSEEHNVVKFTTPGGVSLQEKYIYIYPGLHARQPSEAEFPCAWPGMVGWGASVSSIITNVSVGSLGEEPTPLGLVY